MRTQHLLDRLMLYPKPTIRLSELEPWALGQWQSVALDLATLMEY